MAVNRDTGTWQELYSNYAWFLKEYNLQLSRPLAFLSAMLISYAAFIGFAFSLRGNMGGLQFLQAFLTPQFIPLFVKVALLAVPVSLFMAWLIGYMGDARIADDLRRQLRRQIAKLGSTG
jgi:hypothetical protein